MNCGADGDLLLEDGARDDATPQPELNGVQERVQKIAELKFQMFWFYMIWFYGFSTIPKIPKLLCHDQVHTDSTRSTFSDAKRSSLSIYVTIGHSSPSFGFLGGGSGNALPFGSLVGCVFCFFQAWYLVL